MHVGKNSGPMFAWKTTGVCALAMDGLRDHFCEIFGVDSMPRLFWYCLVLMTGLSGLMGAQFRTPNFMVNAPDAKIAERIGQYAEYWRVVKAQEWLGYEMPGWQQPCPIHVKITLGGSGGATSFVFEQGQILGMDMSIEGTLDRLIASVLPHEITHTVFAHHFRGPLPRWADEGGCVLSEDDLERRRHDQLVREILNTPNRRMALRRLFSLTQYPDDVLVLYAQGFSVVDYLVARSSKAAFLAFLGTGMQAGWDQALRQHYGINSIEALEIAWLQSLARTRQDSALVNRDRNANTTSTALMAATRQPSYNPIPGAVVSAPALGRPQPIVRAASPETPSMAAAGPPAIRLGQPRFENGQHAVPESNR